MTHYLGGSFGYEPEAAIATSEANTKQNLTVPTCSGMDVPRSVAFQLTRGTISSSTRDRAGIMTANHKMAQM